MLSGNIKGRLHSAHQRPHIRPRGGSGAAHHRGGGQEGVQGSDPNTTGSIFTQLKEVLVLEINIYIFPPSFILCCNYKLHFSDMKCKIFLS